MNVPKLRFKEFNDEWDYKIFDELINIKSESYNPSLNKENYKCIELEHINQNTGTINGYCNSQDQKSNKNIFKKNEVLFGKLRPYLKKYWYATFDGVCSSEIWVGKSKNQNIVTNKFIYDLFQSHYFLQLCNLSTGSKMPRADWSFIKEQSIAIPNILEQKKISETLELLDKKIELQSKKIEDLKLFKIYLNTRLFNNSKWNKVKLSEVLEISNVRNKKNIYSKNDVLSVSDEFGVVNQIDLQGRSFAAKDVSDYKIVSKGQIIYTRSPLSSKPYGIIKIVGNIEGIVSPLYIINNVKKEFIPKFIYYLFDLPSSTNNYLRPLVRMGAKHTMNINDDEWLSGEIYAPSIGEQEDIVNIFEIINKKIEIENNKLKKITEFKKGLMQNMFV